jgi:hypothetical protein
MDNRKMPGSPAPTKFDAMINENISVLPTICCATEVPSPPIADSKSVVIICGNRGDGSFLSDQAQELASVLGFEMYSLIECADATTAREKLESFFASEIPGISTKTVVYVGHGIGGKGSFAFDFAADSILIDEDLPNADKVKERFMFMSEFISLANVIPTPECVLYTCACSALASGDVIEYWSLLMDREFLDRNFVKFKVRCTGVEVRELLGFSETDRSCVYNQKRVCQGVSESINIFRRYISDRNDKQLTVWGDDVVVNCSYSLDSNLKAGFINDDDEILRHKTLNRLSLKLRTGTTRG